MATADRAEERVRRETEKTKAKAESGSGWYAVLARVGLVAKGISYGLVGVLALAVAAGHGGKATSRTGALATIADESWGKLVLILLALGFAAYAIWRFVQAVAEREDPGDGEAEGLAKKWGKRAGYLGRGLIYAGLTYTTVRLLTGSGVGAVPEREGAGDDGGDLRLAGGSLDRRGRWIGHHRGRALESLPRREHEVRGQVARRDEPHRADMG